MAAAGIEFGRVVPCDMALKFGMDGIGGWRVSKMGAWASDVGMVDSFSCCCVLLTALSRELFETGIPEDWDKRNEEPEMSSER